jgi:exonuclease III
MAGTINVSTFNVNGLTKGHSKIMDLTLHFSKKDIIFLQETHFPDSPSSSYFNMIFGKDFSIFHSFAISKDSCAGITFLINRNSCIVFEKQLFNIPGRAFGFSCSIDKKKISIFGVYAPADKNFRSQFFDNLYETMTSKFEYYDECILLGDFNFVESPIDRTTTRIYDEYGDPNFTLIKTKFNLHDVFRLNNSDKQDYSHFSGAHRSRARIDRIYCTICLAEAMRNIKHEENTISDHKMVTATFSTALFGLKIGYSYWKFNAKRLLLEKSRTILESIFDSNSPLLNGYSSIENWEKFKQKIQKDFKRAEKFFSKVEKSESERISTELNSLKDLSSYYKTSEELKNKILDLKGKLREAKVNSIDGIILKTHYKHLQSDRFFSIASAKCMQRNSFVDRIITGIDSESGEVIEDQAGILNECKKQYETLFTSVGNDPDAAEEFLFEKKFGIADPEDRELLNSRISTEEVVSAIKHFKGKKSPGEDGLPIEFYVHFSKILAPFLSILYTEIFNQKILCNSMYSGMISQIYKGSGSRTDRKNWRPLTMLNVDYKILARILVSRLRNVMHKIVHPDQNCSVPGRDIRDGLSQIYNIISYAEANDLEGLLLSVDHMTAFDIVEWDYLYRVIDYFELGSGFLDWVKLIYKKGYVKAKIQVNGHVSDEFPITRGIRQGCPLSAFLYVLVSETVTNYIRNMSSIPGMVLLGREYKTSCYADDTNFFVKNFESISNIFEVYSLFKAASGATLKRDKTKILMLGCSKIFLAVPLKFQDYVVEKVKIYGLYFNKSGSDSKENISDFDNTLTKLKTIRMGPEVSYIARSRIADTYYLAKLWYVGPYVEFSRGKISQVDQTIGRFIWATNKNKIKMGKIKKSIKEGGFDKTDIKSKLEAISLMYCLRLKSKGPGSDPLFEYFYDKTRNLNLYQLKKLKIPILYRRIRTCELEINFEYGHPQSKIGNILLDNKTITTKKFYRLLVTKRFDGIDTSSYWEDKLGISAEDIKPLLALHNSKYVDSRAKNVNYDIRMRTLYTNSLESKINVNIDENCKFCLTLGSKIKENVYHGIISCPRAKELWDKLLPFFKQFGIFNFGEANKIFGVKSPNHEVLLNLVIQTAQKAIWFSRTKFVRKDKLDSTFAMFERYLRKQLCLVRKIIPYTRFRELFGNNGIVKLSRYK